MIDQRFGIDIVFILNLSRIKSVYVVFYLFHPQSNIERHKNGNGNKSVAAYLSGKRSISIRRSLSGME